MQKTQIKNSEWLWGTHAVKAAWENPTRQIHSLLVTDNTKDFFKSWVTPKGVKRPNPDMVDRAIFQKRLGPNAVHQGLAVQCSPLEEVFLSDIIIKSKLNDTMSVIILDQVTDPHNVGAILRSACAFGVSAMIVQSRHAPDMTGTLAKSACGAVEHVPIIREVNLSRAIDQLKDADFTVIGLDEEGKDISEIKSVNQPISKTAIVMGAEGPGMRAKVKEHCTQLLRLPTDGPVPTLNVSNAAAVALYALK
jgi:23S rRNA (guanosine2251-2'-O)-methyltransferase